MHDPWSELPDVPLDSAPSAPSFWSSPLYQNLTLQHKSRQKKPP